MGNLTRKEVQNLIEENNDNLLARLALLAVKDSEDRYSKVKHEPEPKPRTGMINCVSELEIGEKYCILQADGGVGSCAFDNDDQDSKWINQGNAAWDKATLERQRDLNELNTRARAASAKAGVIDYSNSGQIKATIHWDFKENRWFVTASYHSTSQGAVQFPTVQSATNFMQSLTPDEQRLFAGGDI